MNKYSLSAMIAAGLLAGSAASASAADLGGNCCADLEERIAELEATTARKGNRKVSLTVSGWVAEQVLWWDDGVEKNMYVTGLGATLASNFKFTGEANIRPGLKAGYVMHIEVNTSDPLSLHQGRDDGASGATGRGPNGVEVLQSYWYLKDNHLGQVSVGQLSHASDNAAILVDGSGSLVPANWVMFDNMSFNLRLNGVLQGQTWGSAFGYCRFIGAGIGGDCNGVPLNAVRYDSPTLAGFSVSASWGEDDFWDATARWAGEFGGFKLAFVASYAHTSERGGPLKISSVSGVDYYQAAGYIQHVPTGLFAYGAYGQEHGRNLDPLGDGLGGEDYAQSPDHWYVKAGIRQKFMPLGHTVLFGEYGQRNNMTSQSFIDAQNAVTFNSQMRQWGLGVVQEIDAAAMSMFLVYRNFDGDQTINGAKANFDNMQIVKFGALISF